MNVARDTQAASEVCHITTKYGPLEVRFGGEKSFEHYDNGKRVNVVMRVARVLTPAESRLK